MQASPLCDFLDYEKVGQGPALLLIHGWPFHAASFRKVVPALSQHFTCYCINSLGMGETPIPHQADMSFAGHAERLLQLIEHERLDGCYVIGHDTGGTIARLAAAKRPEKFKKMVLLNTEVPGHRPPFVPMYQQLLHLPARWSMKWLFSFQTVLRSSLGFGGLFYDKRLINSEFRTLFVDRWVNHPQRFRGMAGYLTGLDFSDIDTLDRVHGQLETPVLFVWGEDDVTFPVAEGRAMAGRMPTCEGFVAVPEACFLVHEERPEVVVQHTLAFFAAESAAG